MRALRFVLTFVLEIRPALVRGGGVTQYQAASLRAISRGHQTPTDILRDRGLNPSSKWAHRNLRRALLRLERAGVLRRETINGRDHWTIAEAETPCAA